MSSTGVQQHTLDPLTLPLTGLQLIEASAGTGKTWTLAALYVRLVLGHQPAAPGLGAGLFPPQILVMTFTEAATAELRERIRERLALSARYFQTRDGALADDFLQALGRQIAPDLWPQCAHRLDVAAQWMDEAAIFTLHGWSSRMLKTHAFDSASLFEQSVVEDGERLQLQAVQDYWRKWLYALPVSELAALQSVGDTPQALLGQLKDRWKLSERAPQPATDLPEAPDVLLARWSLWQRQRLPLQAAARQAWQADVIDAVRAAALAKTLKGYRADWLAGWLAQMNDWAQGGDIKLDTLARFGQQTLLGKGWDGAARWPVFAQLEALHRHLGAAPDVAEGLLSHAAQEVARAYQRAKSRAAQFDFADLLQSLYHALQATDGRLADAIAAQYPVALVDEFQDTDPWQYGALSKIYSCQRNQNKGCSLISSETESASVSAQCLVMIGDPKQAIYSFRGADLATYLGAREQAQGIYTLPGNYRSSAALVAAVNRVFGQASAPFGSVAFAPVRACNAKVLPLYLNGQPQVALTVWQLPFDKTPRKAVFMAEMAAVFASQMVALLQQPTVQPGDMAVLVRDRFEAAAIRTALTQRGVRSVYLSERNSVYASVQASDLWRIVRAVANPGSNRLLRAALATSTWCLSTQALDALLADEAGWDAQVEQFMQWQRVWRTQGFLPMLYRLLHDQGLAARLLAQTSTSAEGERALTNLLHLGELLQAASLELQGEGALLRYLEGQLRRPQASGEAAQLRLESDAHLVQVVTLHKAKGLEYPLVFLPFLSLYRSEDKDSPRPDEERLAEDIRLLYVAMTRAKQALWLGAAQVRGDVEGKSPKPKSALSVLLGRTAAGDLWQRLQTWASDEIAIATAPAPTLARYQPRVEAKTPQPARVPQRLLLRRWWSASFSALTRDLAHGSAPLWLDGRDDQLADAQLDAIVPDDPLAETAALAADLLPPELTYNQFPAGSRYGTLLHDLLEWQAHHGWPGALAEAGDALVQQTQGLRLAAAHSAMLAGWIRQILITNMPLAHMGKALPAIQLAALNDADYWPEMGFAVPVQRLDSQALDAMICRHLWRGADRPALQPRQLEGMLTGFMDLVFVHQGRYFVLDYKSNLLPGYAPAQLQTAMLAHRYDVQATLYLLALHRLLKSRLREAYDYDLHMGGALYLFVRGIDQPGAGLLHLLPPRTLIASLDAAFSQAPSPS